MTVWRWVKCGNSFFWEMTPIIPTSLNSIETKAGIKTSRETIQKCAKSAAWTDERSAEDVLALLTPGQMQQIVTPDGMVAPARSTMTTEDFYRPSTLWKLRTAGNPHRQESSVHPASCPHHQFKVPNHPHVLVRRNKSQLQSSNNLISHWICNILFKGQLLETSSRSNIIKSIGKKTPQSGWDETEKQDHQSSMKHHDEGGAKGLTDS